MNFVEVEVSPVGGHFQARRQGFELAVSPDRGEKAAAHSPVILGIRPEDITVADDGIPGTIYLVEMTCLT